jgi:CHRD domain-containing protein
MRRRVHLGVVAMLAFTLGLGLAVPAPAVARTLSIHAAVLSGDDEVPARDTLAKGRALIMIDDADELGALVVVSRIENVFAAHIHCGAPGVNGPVGVTLFSGDPGGGPFSGLLANDTFLAPDPGNLCDWETIGDVVAAMETGNTYVNVHTNDGVAPPNTGAGDFPGGEIRGQIFCRVHPDD